MSVIRSLFCGILLCVVSENIHSKTVCQDVESVLDSVEIPSNLSREVLKSLLEAAEKTVGEYHEKGIDRLFEDPMLLETQQADASVSGIILKLDFIKKRVNDQVETRLDELGATNFLRQSLTSVRSSISFRIATNRMVLHFSESRAISPAYSAYSRAFICESDDGKTRCLKSCCFMDYGKVHHHFVIWNKNGTIKLNEITTDEDLQDEDE